MCLDVMAAIINSFSLPFSCRKTSKNNSIELQVILPTQHQKNYFAASQPGCQLLVFDLQKK
jgi:hypothetical protein